MVAIINGARVTPPRPDLSVRNIDPNSRLTVVNDPVLVTEKKKPDVSPTKQIARFKPDKLKKSANLRRLEQVRIKQRKGDINEVIFRVKKKISKFKQQQLKGSRFAREVGKGSIFDILA